MDKILFIDGMNAFWRANIVFSGNKQPIIHENCPDCLECNKQENVVVYNFFRSFRANIELFKPDKCFIALEGHPQFRYDLFPEYKGNRIIKTASKQNNRDKLFRASNKIINLLQYLPITLARASEYEADDLIGTLAENMKEESITVITNDDDYVQLLQRGYIDCKIYNPIKKEYMINPKVNFIANKSLTGDKSDNMPSLLTPKKVEACMNDVNKFKQFMDVEENRANFQINRQLIEFRMVPEEDIVLTEGMSNFEELKKEFDKMEFVSIVNEKSWKTFVETFICLIF